MLNISKIIAEKADTIIQQWIEEVRQERRIESAINISDTALGNSLPILLKALAAVLERSQKDFKKIADGSLEHGQLRAQQGYEADEIAQEYSLLRRIIFSVLAPHCLKGSPQEIILLFSKINTVLDEAIALCYKSYVQERFNELEQIQSQLTLTNQELTRLVESSKDNLSYLAHELKTPLTAVIGYSELLQRLQQQKLNAESDTLSLRSIERVLQGGQHLLRIVNDSLELSRYDANQIKLNPECVDVRSMITTVCEMLEPLAQVKGLELKIDCDRAPDQVLTDCFRLQQILTNLVSNAIRYSDVGLIQVICQSLPTENWCLCITDTGIGIAPEDQERIFEPYSQAFFNQRRRQPESTGLGLAIVSRLVHLLGGEIHLVSELSVGSTFTVTLPIKIPINK